MPGDNPDPDPLGDGEGDGDENPAPPIVIQVENLADLLPDKFSWEPDCEDCDEFFRKYRVWLEFHPTKFATEISRVNALHYCLSLSASEWWSSIPVAERPITVDALENIFFLKYRTEKTRQQLKAEIAALKYEPSKPFRNMVNKFQTLSSKLDWGLNVQLEKFIRILPLQIRQFVVSRPYGSFELICASLVIYQQMIEVEQVSAVFKNVSFADLPVCTICGESHTASNCPNVRPVAEPEVMSAKPRSYSRDRENRSYSRDRDSRSKERYRNDSSQRYDSRSSYSPRRNQFRYESRSPSPYRGRGRESNYSRYPNQNYRPRLQSFSPGRFQNNRYQSNSRERYNSRERNYSGDRYEPDYRGRYRSNSRDGGNRNYNDRNQYSPNRENSYDQRQYKYNDYRSQSRDRYSSNSPQRGRPFRGRLNFQRRNMPRNGNSYHAGDSILHDIGKRNIVIDGIKYTAVNNSQATNNSDFQ
jgi:hypothetical protein